MRLRRFFRAITVTLSCLSGLCLPSTLAGQGGAGVCGSLSRTMRQSHIPNVAVASFARGTVQTNYCTAEAQPLSPGAIFEAASLSKPVFAAAVLTLVQQGRLNLDRPLASYLPAPYLHQQNPFGTGASDLVADPRLGRVTARMVLSHTSGLPNWSRHQALTFEDDPGRRWSYSSEGYLYLQRVVEAITGEDLQTVVQKSVLERLGMTHSSFVWRPEYAQEALAPYDAAGVKGDARHYASGLASSTLYTTLDDYAKFVSALLQPEPGSVYAEEESQQVLVRAKLKLGWGLGLAVEDAPRRAYFHWGANPGFQSFFLVEPVSGQGVLFLTDSDSGLDLVDELTGRFVPGEHPALRFPMLHPKD